MVVRRNGRVTSTKRHLPTKQPKGSGDLAQQKGAAANRNACKYITLPLGQHYDTGTGKLSLENPPDLEEPGE
jgi:hypothetical protein